MRMRPRVIKCLVIPVFGLFILAGCARAGGSNVLVGAPATPAASPTQSTPAASPTQSSPPDQRLSQRVDSTFEAGVTLTPPAQDAVAIPESVARRAAEAVFGSAVVASKQPKLANFNDKNMGKIGADGSVTLDYVNRLVWAYIGYQACDQQGGLAMMGPNGVPVVATYRPGLTCIGVIVVDAHTGQYLMGYSEAANASSIHPSMASPGS